MRIRKPDISVQSGIKRQIESTDRPVYMPNHILNQVQKQVGVWERRDDQGYLYPDRNNHVEYTTPKVQRGVDDTDTDDINVEYGRYYNSAKRKTIAIGVNGGKTYYFSGVIKSYVKSASGYVRLKLYRGEVMADGVTIEWSNYAHHTSIAGISHSYDPDQYLEYSMVISADYSKLYIAIVLRDGQAVDGYHSRLRLIEVSNLYADDWDDGNVNPEWNIITRAGNDVLEYNGANEFLTHDVDLEIDDNGTLHIVAGYQDVAADPEFEFKYIRYTSGVWGNLIGVYSGVAGINFYGCVLVINPVVPDDPNDQALYLAYMAQDAVSDDTIRYKTWAVSASPPAGQTVVDSSIYIGANASDCWAFGPVLCIDGDGTLVFGYRGSAFQLMVKVNDNTRAMMASYANIAEGHTLNGNWDIIAKDGIVLGYYGYWYIPGQEPYPSYIYDMRRVAMIYDTADAEYTDGSFFDWERIELDPEKHLYVTAYRKYEADARKLLSYVNYTLEVGAHHGFGFIRQDRSDAVFKQPHSYEGTGFTGKQNRGYGSDATQVESNLLVFQCEVYEDSDGVDKSYRFYERWNYYYRLLPGQMDDINGAIIQETIVDTKAHFWDRFRILRAGCGIEKDNRPIWYGDIDRRYYDNNMKNFYRDRLFRLAELPAPQVTSAANADENTIGVIIDGAIDLIAYIALGAEVTAKYTEFFGGGIDYGTGTLSGFMVTSPYKTLHDRCYDDDPVNADTAFEGGGAYENFDRGTYEPYHEVYLAFAYIYDELQVSQLVPQETDDPYEIGTVFTLDGGGANPANREIYHNVVMQVEFRLPNGISDLSRISRRITGIACFVGLKQNKGDTKWDVNYRLWQSYYVAKPFNEPFNDELENGDKQWTEVGNYLELGTDASGENAFLDFRQYELNSGLENHLDYVGSGLALNKDNLKHYLDGYERATVVQDRPFYLGVRVNGKKAPDMFTWAPNAVQAAVGFIVPDIISPAFSATTGFTIQNGKSYGENNLVVFGDTDIIWGDVSGSELEWNIRETKQDIGTNAPDSVALVAERKENEEEYSLFFLSGKNGGKAFNLYGASPVTKDVNNDFVGGGNPSGSRVETTYKGVSSYSASDAIAIHLPNKRLFLLHFPTDGYTLVRDFNAEDNVNTRFHWVEFKFGYNPTAIALARDQYLVMTDGSNVFRFPDTSNDNLDVDVAFAISGRLADIKIADFSTAELNRIYADYLVAGTTITLRIVRDDGKRGDVVVTLPASSTYSEYTRRVGFQKPIREKLALLWEVTDPSLCTGYELHKLAANYEEDSDE